MMDCIVLASRIWRPASVPTRPWRCSRWRPVAATGSGWSTRWRPSVRRSSRSKDTVSWSSPPTASPCTPCPSTPSFHSQVSYTSVTLIISTDTSVLVRTTNILRATLTEMTAVAKKILHDMTKECLLFLHELESWSTISWAWIWCDCGERWCIAGERYDFVITADQPTGAYWMQVRGLGECGEQRAQQLAIVRYARGPYTPRSAAPTYDVGLPQGIVSAKTLVASLTFDIFTIIPYVHSYCHKRLILKFPDFSWFFLTQVPIFPDLWEGKSRPKHFLVFWHQSYILCTVRLKHEFKQLKMTIWRNSKANHNAIIVKLNVLRLSMREIQMNYFWSLFCLKFDQIDRISVEFGKILFIYRHFFKLILFLQVLNPLDAICNTDRTDAVCVNQLKNAKQVDEGILQERPDVKIFLPFRFLFYTPEEVFEPHTYNRFLGKSFEFMTKSSSLEHFFLFLFFVHSSHWPKLLLKRQ